MFVQRQFKCKWMDATNLHIKLKLERKLKYVFFPLHCKLPKEVLLWSSRLLSVSSMGEEKHPEAEDSASNGPVKRFSFMGILITK